MLALSHAHVYGARRVAPAPITHEDHAIELLVGVRFYGRVWGPHSAATLSLAIQRADRRDAELMWCLTRTGALTPKHPTGRAVAHSLVSCGLEPESLLHSVAFLE